MFQNRHSAGSQRDHRRPAMMPRLEGLEDRMLLYAFNGGEWVFGSRITYSFAPDGTDVGGVSSNLNAALSARGLSTQTWQTQFRKAAALWQSVANINLVEVNDSGAAFSAGGNQQNDSRFGDIRIAGVGLDSNVLGMAFLPPPINGGTLAGDIVLNSSANWSVNGNYDVMTVALHEFGHALGLDHSNIQSAVMYAYYNGMKQSFHTDDQNGIRAIYSGRQPDVFDAARSNDAYTTATMLTSYIDSNLQVRQAGLDMSSSADNDWFAVVVPPGAASTMTVTVQSSGLSMLSPRLTVHSTALAVLGQTSSTDFGATISVTINNVTPGQGFYFRVQTATGGGALTGNYGLLVNFSNQSIAPIAPPDTTVTQQPNRGGGFLGMGADEDAIKFGNIDGFGDHLLVSEFPQNEGARTLAPLRAKILNDLPILIAAALLDTSYEPSGLALPRGKAARERLIDRVLETLQSH